jgi:hypothetical protein
VSDAPASAGVFRRPGSGASPSTWRCSPGSSRPPIGVVAKRSRCRLPTIGSAIGLTIARADGGDVTAHSDGPGRGARFTLRASHATDDAPAPWIDGAVQPVLRSEVASRVGQELLATRL